RVAQVSQVGSRALERRRELVDRRGEIVGLRGQRAGGDVEVRDQALQRLLVRGELREDVARRSDQVREVVWVLSQQGLIDDRGGPARLAAVAEGLVERLGRGFALDGGVLGGVLGGGWN